MRTRSFLVPCLAATWSLGRQSLLRSCRWCLMSSESAVTGWHDFAQRWRCCSIWMGEMFRMCSTSESTRAQDCSRRWWRMPSTRNLLFGRSSLKTLFAQQLLLDLLLPRLKGPRTCWTTMQHGRGLRGCCGALRSEERASERNNSSAWEPAAWSHRANGPASCPWGGNSNPVQDGGSNARCFDWPPCFFSWVHQSCWYLAWLDDGQKPGDPGDWTHGTDLGTRALQQLQLIAGSRHSQAGWFVKTLAGTQLSKGCLEMLDKFYFKTLSILHREALPWNKSASNTFQNLFKVLLRRVYEHKL